MIKNILIALLLITGISLYSFKKTATTDEKIISYIVNPAKQDLALYWKDDSGHIIGSFTNLQKMLATKHHKLIFAMNGGMYTEAQSPVGLYIEKFKTLSALNKRTGSGNFYMEPNGIFYLTKTNKAVICSRQSFSKGANIKFATQSGPMLVINGGINPLFKEGSVNLNIRNGVGILPDGRVIFAISKEPVSFFDFAAFFKKQGCANALYLDGFISRAYIPSQNWLQADGNFGVMIGVDQ